MVEFDPWVELGEIHSSHTDTEAAIRYYFDRIVIVPYQKNFLASDIENKNSMIQQEKSENILSKKLEDNDRKSTICLMIFLERLSA